MRYTYAYKTSDGTRHEASMEAESREEVFATLRAQGIKAIKVVAADGSKANGAPAPSARRTPRAARGTLIVLGAACLALGAGVVAYRGGTRSVASVGGDPPPLTANRQPLTASSPRHQIYGDPVIVEAFERGHFDSCLTNRLDRMLAWFAQPGKLMCPKGTDPRREADVFEQAVKGAVGASVPLARNRGTTGNPLNGDCGHAGRVTLPSVPIAPDDLREVRELKQIVNGLREEMAAYLANGNGTPRSYWRRLLQRTQQEMQICERTRRELERETDPAVWEEKNAALRTLGLRPIPNPKDAE